MLTQTIIQIQIQFGITLNTSKSKTRRKSHVHRFSGEGIKHRQQCTLSLQALLM